MKNLPEPLLSEAFALSKARGAQLLVRLGAFNVWNGDLSTMRGDVPKVPTANEHQEGTKPTKVFLDTLVLAQAIERLQPVCRAALAALYGEQKDTASLAADLETEPAYAQKIVTTCEQRLIEAYNELAKTSSVDALTVPQWVSEREHAAAAGSRRR